MIIEKKTGGILIYELVNEHLVQRFYVGYNKREAISKFKADIKTNGGN